MNLPPQPPFGSPSSGTPTRRAGSAPSSPGAPHYNYNPPFHPSGNPHQNAMMLYPNQHQLQRLAGLQTSTEEMKMEYPCLRGGSILWEGSSQQLQKLKNALLDKSIQSMEMRTMQANELKVLQKQSSELTHYQIGLQHLKEAQDAIFHGSTTDRVKMMLEEEEAVLQRELNKRKQLRLALDQNIQQATNFVSGAELFINQLQDLVDSGGELLDIARHPVTRIRTAWGYLTFEDIFALPIEQVNGQLDVLGNQEYHKNSSFKQITKFYYENGICNQYSIQQQVLRGPTQWNDDTLRRFLALYLDLLPKDVEFVPVKRGQRRQLQQLAAANSSNNTTEAAATSNNNNNHALAAAANSTSASGSGQPTGGSSSGGASFFSTAGGAAPSNNNTPTASNGGTTAATMAETIDGPPPASSTTTTTTTATTAPGITTAETTGQPAAAAAVAAAAIFPTTTGIGSNSSGVFQFGPDTTTMMTTTTAETSTGNSGAGVLQFGADATTASAETGTGFSLSGTPTTSAAQGRATHSSGKRGWDAMGGGIADQGASGDDDNNDHMFQSPKRRRQ